MRVKFWGFVGKLYYQLLKKPVILLGNWIGAKQWEAHRDATGAEHEDNPLFR
jgi:hypothetical protein